MNATSRRGYCPHFGEVMDLDNCFFCHFKFEREKEKTKMEDKNNV